MILNYVHFRINYQMCIYFFIIIQVAHIIIFIKKMENNHVMTLVLIEATSFSDG